MGYFLRSFSFNISLILERALETFVDKSNKSCIFRWKLMCYSHKKPRNQ